MDKQNWGIELYANGMTNEESTELCKRIKEILYDQKIPAWAMRLGFGVKIPKRLHDKDYKPEES